MIRVGQPPEHHRSQAVSTHLDTCPTERAIAHVLFSRRPGRVSTSRLEYEMEPPSIYTERCSVLSRRTSWHGETGSKQGIHRRGHTTAASGCAAQRGRDPGGGKAVVRG